MQDLVHYIAKQLVEHPDQVEISTQDAEGVVQMTLKVAESDKGKIIGKQGKVIKAIRALVAAASLKQNKKANLEVA